jgi:hypothetical protein
MNDLSHHVHPQVGMVDLIARTSVVVRVQAGTPVAEVARGMCVFR